MMRLILTALTILAMLAPPLAAREDQHSPYFETLLESLPEGSYEALDGWEEALRRHLKALLEEHDDAENVAGVRAILGLVEAPRLDFDSESELVGDWRVRSLQADSLGAYVYSWFPARIYREAQALVFDKDSGSQRHRGLMARASADAFFFAGALYYGYQPPRLHSAHMDLAAEGEPDPDYDATALLYKLGPEHYLMVFNHGSGRFRFYEISK